MRGTIHAALVVALFFLLMALWATTPGYEPSTEMKLTAGAMTAAVLTLLYRNRRHL